MRTSDNDLLDLALRAYFRSAKNDGIQPDQPKEMARTVDEVNAVKYVVPPNV